jgi:TPR repeat protein
VRGAASVLAATLVAGAAQAADADLGRRCAASVDSGDYRICEQAAAAAPTNLAVRRAFARALLIGGANNRAVFEYDRVARMAPDDSQAHFDLAAVLGALNYFEDAEAPLARALELRPDFSDAHRLAVILYQHLRRWDEALAHCRILAAQGDSTAMFDISIAYELGRGAPQSQAEALAWLVKAAEAGHVGAADRLTDIYLEGLMGVPQDEAEGLAWAARARLARQQLR